MLGIQIREIVNLSDDSLWGHRVSVSEPALTATHPRHGAGSDVTKATDSAPPPDVASIANVIIDELGTLRADATTHSLASLQSPRVILDLPHRFWSDAALLTRICLVLHASVPGIYQSIELNLSLATAVEVATAAALREAGTANVVITNALSDPHWAHINQVKPHAILLSETTLGRVSSGEYSATVARTGFDLVRLLGVMTIACDLVDAAQATLLHSLGCTLGIYRDAIPEA